MHRFLIRTLLLAMLMLCFSLPDMAQGETPPDDPGNDPALPIDGGISLLLATGAAYGVRKIYSIGKGKSPNNQI